MANAYVDMGLSAPVNVTWEVTYGCNLSCVHCLSDAGRPRRGEMDTLQCRQVIDTLADHKVFQFNIGGGEPLMRPDFLDLMDYAHGKGMVTCISTNGTLIARIEYRPDCLAIGFDYVGVSLDGIAATHDRFRRKQGAFAKSLAALRACRDLGVKVGVRFTLTQDNSRTCRGSSTSSRTRGSTASTSRTSTTPGAAPSTASATRTSA